MGRISRRFLKIGADGRDNSARQTLKHETEMSRPCALLGDDVTCQADMTHAILRNSQLTPTAARVTEGRKIR